MDDDFADDGIIARTAADLLQVSLARVQCLIDAGVLPARRIGSRLYVRRADVLALVAGGPDSAPPRPAAPAETEAGPPP